MRDNVTILNHPLIRHKITYLRDVSTDTKSFRELASEIAMLMAYEATHDLALEPVEVTTPLETCKGERIAGKGPVLVPILRAGLGMVDGILKLLPRVAVGHIGLYRDEKTLMPVEYYVKLPDDIADRPVLLIDPMLATGGSASLALTYLKSKGVRNLTFLCLIAAPEGIQMLDEEHPDIPVYAGVLDRSLNEQGYILPGLGDAGDRLFGTD